MKIDFEIKGLKWSVDAELPQQLLDTIGAVAEAVRADLPAVIQSGLAKVKAEIDSKR